MNIFLIKMHMNIPLRSQNIKAYKFVSGKFKPEADNVL